MKPKPLTRKTRETLTLQLTKRALQMLLKKMLRRADPDELTAIGCIEDELAVIDIMLKDEKKK